MSVGVGDVAPDFTLEAIEHGEPTELSLSDYSGRPIVLVFYPGDETPICVKQLNAYNDGLDRFAELDAQVLAVSAQGLDSKTEFASKYGFSFPLMADVDKRVAASYGTLGPIGFPRRSVFIIDRDGIIRYVHRAIAGLTFRPVDELVAEVTRLSDR